MIHSLYVKNHWLYVIVSILLILAIMISMCTPANAVAATAVAVTVAGVLLIASVFTAIGLTTDNNNLSSNTELVNACLEDGKTQGIFDSSGNIVLHEIGSVSLVAKSVVDWVKSWFVTKTGITATGDYTVNVTSRMTVSTILTAHSNGVTLTPLSYTRNEMIAWFDYMGYTTLSDKFADKFTASNDSLFVYAGDGTSGVLFRPTYTFGYTSSFGDFLSVPYSGTGWSWSSNRFTSSDNSVVRTSATKYVSGFVDTYILGNYVGNTSIDSYYPKWYAHRETLVIDDINVDCLPMTIPDTVQDALTQTQVEAQGATDLGYSSNIDPDNGSGPVIAWFDNIFSGIWEYAESVISYCIQAANAFVVCLSAFLPTKVQDYIWLCAGIVIIFGTFKLFIR